jgi:hypothetical protein
MPKCAHRRCAGGMRLGYQPEHGRTGVPQLGQTSNAWVGWSAPTGGGGFNMTDTRGLELHPNGSATAAVGPTSRAARAAHSEFFLLTGADPRRERAPDFEQRQRTRRGGRHRHGTSALPPYTSGRQGLVRGVSGGAAILSGPPTASPTKARRVAPRATCGITGLRLRQPNSIRGWVVCRYGQWD